MTASFRKVHLCMQFIFPVYNLSGRLCIFIHYRFMINSKLYRLFNYKRSLNSTFQTITLAFDSPTKWNLSFIEDLSTLHHTSTHLHFCVSASIRISMVPCPTLYIPTCLSFPKPHSQKVELFFPSHLCQTEPFSPLSPLKAVTNIQTNLHVLFLRFIQAFSWGSLFPFIHQMLIF